MHSDRDQLITREKFLEDVIESLDDMRLFAIRTKDWPRKSETERALKQARERHLNVQLRLAAASSTVA